MIFNVTVVYTDGRSKGGVNLVRLSREDAIRRELEDAKAWNEEILSITVIEKERK
jgi:hypothetical protein